MAVLQTKTSRTYFV